MNLDLIKERLYYSIGEVCEILGLRASTIRYWEKHFSILRPTKRTGNSKRKFDFKDIQILFKIKTVLKNDNYSIKKANLVLKDWMPLNSFEEFSKIVDESCRPRIFIPNEKLDKMQLILKDVRKLLYNIK